MSLLLDALRKSEKRRRGGTPPPLGLPAGPGAGAPIRGGNRSRRRLGLVLLVVVGVLAIALAAWWGAGRPGQEQIRSWLAPTPDEAAEANSAGSAGSADDATERQLVADAYRRPANDGGSEVGPITTPGSEPEPTAGGSSGDRSADRSVNQSADRADSTTADGMTARPDPDPAAEPGGERTARRPAQETPNESARPAVQLPPAEQAAAAEGGSDSTGLDEAPAAETTGSGAVPSAGRETGSGPSRERSEPRDDTITPWELPSAVRADLPPIDVAVHFYAPDASNRFVLIEGERYTEGDTIASGVELTEIRRSGIVVDFQNYRVRIE